MQCPYRIKVAGTENAYWRCQANVGVHDENGHILPNPEHTKTEGQWEMPSHECSYESCCDGSPDA